MGSRTLTTPIAGPEKIELAKFEPGRQYKAVLDIPGTEALRLRRKVQLGCVTNRTQVLAFERLPQRVETVRKVGRGLGVSMEVRSEDVFSPLTQLPKTAFDNVDFDSCTLPNDDVLRVLGDLNYAPNTLMSLTVMGCRDGPITARFKARMSKLFPAKTWEESFRQACAFALGNKREVLASECIPYVNSINRMKVVQYHFRLR